MNDEKKKNVNVFVELVAILSQLWIENSIFLIFHFNI